MYSATNYIEPSLNSPTYQIIGDQATADSTIVRVKVETTDTSVAVYPNTIHITIVLSPPEIEEPRPRRIRKPSFQPPVREIASPWQAKWRPTQQRPRDGLFS